MSDCVKSPARATALAPPTADELRRIFSVKHGHPSRTGPAPRRRYRFGYFPPDDQYEALVDRLITPGAAWLDVGGGSSPFPHNPALARELSGRCRLLVGVDPSDNILANSYAHERARCGIQDYETTYRFDVITLRMVAEHIADPGPAAAKLAGLLTPGGAVVVYTVNLYAAVTLVSRMTPHRAHHRVKSWFWGGEEKDTFPTVYRMNTRSRLRHWFVGAGLRERLFLRVDDLATFGQFPTLNRAELMLWRALKSLRLPYPESCLIAVYGR